MGSAPVTERQPGFSRGKVEAIKEFGREGIRDFYFVRDEEKKVLFYPGEETVVIVGLPRKQPHREDVMEADAAFRAGLSESEKLVWEEKLPGFLFSVSDAKEQRDILADVRDGTAPATEKMKVLAEMEAQVPSAAIVRHPSQRPSDVDPEYWQNMIDLNRFVTESLLEEKDPAIVLGDGGKFMEWVSDCHKRAANREYRGHTAAREAWRPVLVPGVYREIDDVRYEHAVKFEEVLEIAARLGDALPEKMDEGKPFAIPMEGIKQEFGDDEIEVLNEQRGYNLPVVDPRLPTFDPKKRLYRHPDSTDRNRSAYLSIARESLLKLMTGETKGQEGIMNGIADAYRALVSLHPFPGVNNSCIWGIMNPVLEHFGFQRLSHGRLDYEAMFLEGESWRDRFKEHLHFQQMAAIIPR